MILLYVSFSQWSLSLTLVTFWSESSLQRRWGSNCNVEKSYHHFGWWKCSRDGDSQKNVPGEGMITLHLCSRGGYWCQPCSALKMADLCSKHNNYFTSVCHHKKSCFAGCLCSNKKSFFFKKLWGSHTPNFIWNCTSNTWLSCMNIIIYHIYFM